jgi:hypothetical protein
MTAHENSLAFAIPPKENISVNGEVLSLDVMEKIFFLYKLSPDSSFIASTLSLPVTQVDAIINSHEFELVISDHLGNFLSGTIGERPEQLALRYSDFLRELFLYCRMSIGLYCRDMREKGRPLQPKHLFIPQIEKLMKMEFALHGIPVDLRGVLHKGKESKEKSDKELIESVNGLNQTLQEATGKSFDPLKFDSGNIEDVKDQSDTDTNEKDIDDADGVCGPGMPLKIDGIEDEDIED